MDKETLREALDFDVTARERRILSNRAINIEPNGADIKSDSMSRASQFISVAHEIKALVECYPTGITMKELDTAEFVIEQLESLSRLASETAIKNY